MAEIAHLRIVAPRAAINRSNAAALLLNGHYTVTSSKPSKPSGEKRE